MVECFDINFSDLSVDDKDKQFHSVVGHIEDILMEDEFVAMHNAFMEKHWTEFEDTEENKFIYTDIFREYGRTIEKYIEEELNDRVPNFNMIQFENELKLRQHDLDGEIFEMLATFSDFCAFKMMFLDYKNVSLRMECYKNIIQSFCLFMIWLKMKEGRTVDFSLDLSVSKYVVNPF
ncbi:PREDICTED: ADP-ribosylation factor-like protein 2-binding protein isoform X2 [Nicrophorus vespilloides]|uniref:ADP-ribosylation factor-like protein 2-binding protein n=1 Tax=Nicrophorus vespilloides TaxID=110193 RepID=A0ABM1N143_NICVS|nr:PREDICTED: ADP-ribosylation factor-like protein 2-binding protein isoform X2 [Nicrophorus vespilloides]